MTSTVFDPAELLRRGIVSAGSAFATPDVEQKITDHLVAHFDPPTVAATLARAMVELAKPARIGRLDELVEHLAEVMFDDAHENCDDEEGCTGGGKPYYRDYVTNLLLPVLEDYAVADAGPEVCGIQECSTVLPGGCCHDLLDEAEAAEAAR